ncbi:MAG: c-type cytochrome [candidate division Zixibacteria bacterium]|nr:c-type cytochrome [candidate division Zixibacteria bacterium]
MNYPFWDTATGYGLLMAGIAVFHVFISHFAIGGGLYLVVAETFARRTRDSARLAYLKGLSKFFVLTTLVLGAVTGVGIWFIIGLLNPAATEMLIHNFVWGWATEWTFFVVEIAAALIYLYGWDRMAAKDHQIVGWIYFGAAWMSLFIINGILSFMLTPGTWLATGNFWDGFFNPTFLSSLVLRTGVSILLAGLFSLLVAARLKDPSARAATVRYNTIWGLVGLAVMAPSLLWFWNAIPDSITQGAVDTMRLPLQAYEYSWWLAGVLAALLIVFGLLFSRRFSIIVAAVMMALGLVWFGSFEWMRESIRKPFVVYDYMYGNATELALADTYRDTGLLTHIEFRTGDDGADLFRHACRSCHTIDGYQPLKPAFDGTDPEYIAGIVLGTVALRGNMPPFLGTEEEAALIGDHIYGLIDQRHLAEITGAEGAELGKRVYDVRCGRCHVFGGYSDKAESILGMEAADLEDLLDMAGDLGEEMPAFTGDDVERAALIAYLTSLATDGGQN